jgi:NhaC family Na+:H+ antiporter
LILAVNASGIGLNVIAGDQYVADVLPARMFREEFARRGLAPQALSRAVEDSGTVTSVLVPWNTCGAYISGVLGVSTGAYLPYCFFNILSPMLDVVFRFLGSSPHDPRTGAIAGEWRGGGAAGPTAGSTTT